MRRMTVIFPIVLMCLLGCAGCKTKSKGVTIAQDGHLKVGSMAVSENGEVSGGWGPGIVVLFRTTGKVPNGKSGNSGTAYVITEKDELREIGKFDQSKSDEELVKEFLSY